MIRRRVIAVLIVVLFLTSLLVPSSQSSQDSSLTKKQQSEVLSQADSILKELSTMLGISTVHPVQRQFMSRAQLRDLLLRYAKEQKNQATLEAERKTMVKFGFISKDFPYSQFALDLLTEQIAGFYDYRTHQLNLMDSTPVNLQVPVLIHELTHALQDQEINLKEFNEPAEHNDDLTEAHESMVEGEATAVMLDYILQPSGRSLATLGFDVREMMNDAQAAAVSLPNYRNAPKAIQVILTAPYLYGTSFFQFFRNHNDWPRAAALFKDPPSSMEQMMHPEKYFTHRDDPVAVAIPGLPQELQKTWKPVDTNVLGELGMLLVCQQFLSDDNAKIASEGWGGDQYQLFEDTRGNLLLLLFSTWDTETDATQFFNSYRVLLDKKYKHLKLLNGEEHKLFRWDSDDNQVAVEIQGHDVIVIEGAPAAQFEALRTLLWKSAQTAPHHPAAKLDAP
ncbi:MAG: hypothetical protein PHX83_01550 [Acidobacteriia bacterium]|nr:hypothetical protein [Terriglobia bacterium]